MNCLFCRGNSTPLNGNDLDDKLQSLIGYKIKFDKSFHQCFADEECEYGVVDSVSRQEHFVNCSINGKILSFTKAIEGQYRGIVIPYIGKGLTNPKGKSRSAHRGLGTYTSPINSNSQVSWVCTGKFNGCYAYDIREDGDPNSALIFGHLITPADGYTADDVDSQVTNIKIVTGFTGVEHKDKISPPGLDKMLSDGAFVFWLKTGGHHQWERRIVWVGPDNKIVAVDDGVDATCCVDCSRCSFKWWS